MRKAIVLLACLLLVTPVVSPQRKRPKPKPKPKSDADLFQDIPKDEMLFDEDDKYITLDGWHLAVRSDKKADGSQTLTYYDPNRITQPRGASIKQFWLKSELVKDGKLDSYWMDFHELNCTERRMRILESHEYDKDGTQTNSDTVDRVAWRRLVPDSVGESVYGVICKGEKSEEQKDKEEAARFFMVARGFEKKNNRARALLWYKWALDYAPDNPKILAAIERVR